MYQRSDEWFAERIGKITASGIKNLSAKPQKGKALNAYLLQILAERITGTKAEPFTSMAMQWGIDNEPIAKQAYERQVFCTVVDCRFYHHPTIAMSGASPDGLVGDDGLIEIKCPDTTTHLNTLLKGDIPSEHLPQIGWQLACTGRAWCDFVSFDPRLPSELQLFIKRVHRDEVDIDTLEAQVTACNALLDKTLTQLEQNNGQ